MSALSDAERAAAAGLRITFRDMLKAGHCGRGVRDWFERHGLDFNAMRRNGIDALVFADRGDALSAEIIRKTLKRRSGTQPGVTASRPASTSVRPRQRQDRPVARRGPRPSGRGSAPEDAV